MPVRLGEVSAKEFCDFRTRPGKARKESMLLFNTTIFDAGTQSSGVADSAGPEKAMCCFMNQGTSNGAYRVLWIGFNRWLLKVQATCSRRIMILPTPEGKWAVDHPRNIVLDAAKSPTVEISDQLQRRQNRATEQQTTLRVRKYDALKTCDFTRPLQK
jgi:hypothetical protein